MKAHSLIAICLLVFTLACKEDTPPSEPILKGSTTFYLIRHAEKERSNPEDADPELNQKGLGRAMHWAEILDDVSLDAIYSTDYNRTSMTAAPVSVKQNVDVQYYDQETWDIDKLKRDHINQKVLIVGHSNTTPDMVNKLLGEEKYGQLDDNENGALFIVTLIDGEASATRLNFSCNCPR
ncbi:SixA phosphatase family protein [Maribacter sp. 2307ULW6-5]|uniref:SixA phosphatase family protein n=1 Tax=Maribacter sp. 2307ULW6-5 TaxID=3386275 RepID=UPI0039BD63FC